METTASLNGQSWPVKIRRAGTNNYIVSGRGTSLDVAIRLSNGIGGGRFIIAVTNWNRCGCLGPYTDITASDVQQYIGLENPVDAATLAAALNNIFGDL